MPTEMNIQPLKIAKNFQGRLFFEKNVLILSKNVLYLFLIENYLFIYNLKTQSYGRNEN